MTWEDLKALVAGGESLTLEFKRDAPLPDSEIAEAVVCLANTDGGMLLLGVDKDGRTTGLHSKRFPVRPRLLEALIANRTIPGVRVRVELVAGDGETVAAVQVDKSNHIVQTSDGRAPRRMIVGKGEPECRPMHPAEIASRLSYLGGIQNFGSPALTVLERARSYRTA